MKILYSYNVYLNLYMLTLTVNFICTTYSNLHTFTFKFQKYEAFFVSLIVDGLLKVKSDDYKNGNSNPKINGLIVFFLVYIYLSIPSNFQVKFLNEQLRYLLLMFVIFSLFRTRMYIHIF